MRFAKRIATGNNRLHCLFRQGGISTHQGWRFSAGCSSSQSQYWQLSDVRDGVPDQVALQCINNPVLFWFTACLPLEESFPVRLLPSCTTICACCSSLVAWHCLTRDRHTAAAVRFATARANQRPAKSLRPQCNFFALFPLMRPATTTPRFCRQKNQSRVFHFPDEALHAATVCRPATSAQPLLPANPGVVHFAIQRFTNGQLIWTPPA